MVSTISVFGCLKEETEGMQYSNVSSPSKLIISISLPGVLEISWIALIKLGIIMSALQHTAVISGYCSRCFYILITF